MRRFVLRLYAFLRPAKAERELARETASHLALLEEEFLKRGMSPEEASFAAKRAMGGIEQAKECQRDTRSFAWLEDAKRDLFHAARLLRRNPLFAATAAISLAVGIGANITIFTIANALLFRPPVGVAEQDGLLDIFRAEQGKPFANFTASYPYYLDVRQRTTTLEGLYAYEFELHPVSLGTASGTDTAFANFVTHNYFATLGVVPVAGRLFGATDDDRPGASPVVVLSYRLWQRRFNAHPDVIGQTVQINRHAFTVIGVTGEGFRGTNLISADLWLPMGMVGTVDPRTRRLTSRGAFGLGMGGRLRAGVSRPRAAAELDAIALALEHENPIEDRASRLRVSRLSTIPGALRAVAAGFFSLLLALVTVVLAIACANIAGVLLARAAARRREIAVRIAIGAGRTRLVRQLLTETTLLFALGGAAGLLLARGMTSLLLSILPVFPLPVEVSLPLDVRVVVFTIGLSFISALLCGLAPALHASKADVVVALKDESQGPSERLRMRSVFVAAQVAFSILLVVVAGLLGRALQRISSTDLGFDPRGVEMGSLELSSAGYTATTGALFARDLVDRVRALPGVEAATLSTYLPGRGGADVNLTIPGISPADGRPFFTATWNAVDSDYFATLRIPIVAGRDFTAADRTGAQRVAIIGEAAARYFWPGQDQVGKYMTWLDSRSDRPGDLTSVQVVGVARDLTSPVVNARNGIRSRTSEIHKDGQQIITVSGPSSLMMYIPLQQRYTPRLTILVRTASGRRMAWEIERLVMSMDPNLPMLRPERLDAQTGPVHVQLRIAAAVAGSVGVIGLLLAAIGIYGVTAYTITQRTREIGIRIALGAQSGDVVSLVLRQGMALVAIGATIGLTLTAVVSRLFASLLFGVPPLDPTTFSGAALLFAIVGFVACYLPALRVMKVDPLVALRCE